MAPDVITTTPTNTTQSPNPNGIPNEAHPLIRNTNGRRKQSKEGWGLYQLEIFIIALAFLSVLVLLDMKLEGANDVPHTETNSELKLQDFAEMTLQSLNKNIVQIPTTKTNTNCEATVLLIRHCDDFGLYAKDDIESGDKHCSFVGFQRAQYLTSLFAPTIETPSTGTTTTAGNGKWPSPSFLYAQLPEQPVGTNYRQIETLLPLSEQFDVPIHIVQEPAQLAESYFQLLQESPDEVCGTVTVVAWKHAFMPKVAANLGCSPKRGCMELAYPDEEFDQVWQLKFVFDPPMPFPLATRVAEGQDGDDNKSKKSLLLDDYGLLLSSFSSHEEINDQMKSKDEPKGEWTVYGSIVYQQFDPLRYSAANGAYSRIPADKDDRDESGVPEPFHLRRV